MQHKMDPLAFVIGQEEASLKTFVSTLLEEQNVLKSGNTDALEDIVKKKNQLLETLGRLGHQRNQLLGKARLAEDREGLTQWASHAGQSALVEMFLKLADEARELNRLNGQLISMRLNSTQAALAALTPHRAPSQGLYGPKGQTRFSTGYRLIDTV